MRLTPQVELNVDYYYANLDHLIKEDQHSSVQLWSAFLISTFHFIALKWSLSLN